jgi:hypothetical protein
MYTGVAAILVKLHKHHDREMSQEAHQRSRSFTEAASAPAAAVEAPLEPTRRSFCWSRSLGRHLGTLALTVICSYFALFSIIICDFD